MPAARNILLTTRYVTARTASRSPFLTMRPSNRRHSFSSFNIVSYRHKNIPKCETSHPDNPIPTEPRSIPQFSMSPQQKAALSTSQSPRSSGESLTSSDDASDSETPSTPPTEPADDAIEKIQSLPAGAINFNGRRQSSPEERQNKRRASTQLIAKNANDIRRLLGNGEGTKFLQKYCCGEGCCMLETLEPDTSAPDYTPVVVPDNEAFRALNLKLGALTLETPLTRTLDLSESKIFFAPIRKQSISEKFPAEEAHQHDRQTVNVQPPEYVQPHPPYNVFSAPVYGARQLTKPGAEKRTFHFDLDVTDYPAEGGVDFKVGGAVGICPPNDPVMVEDVFDQLCIPSFARDKPTRLITTGGRWPTIWGDEAARELVTTRRELLTWCSDISSAPLTKPLLRLFAEYAEAKNEKKILLYLSSAQGQAAFCDLRTGPHITLQQLLHAFPSSKPPLEKLCGVLNQLMPRFYSLSNDPHVSSAREGLAGRRLIEMAVTIHETPNYHGGPRTGVGSGYLERVAKQFIDTEVEAERQANEGKFCLHPGRAGRDLNLRIPMFRGLMANPLSKEFGGDGPMMLIGAGVGMAPFRGFILNRLKNANCANKIWLVQGVRDSMLDEIYSGELGDHEKEIKKVVQSRAPPPVAEEQDGVEETGTGNNPEAAVVTDDKKNRRVAKYVQDEVRLQADIVWFVINAIDGRIFVCGSTKGMGEGVEKALLDVAMDKGNLDFETAKEFWQRKKDAGQYIAVSSISRRDLFYQVANRTLQETW